MATQKELAMQAQIDLLTSTLTSYMAETRKTNGVLFAKLDEAKDQRNRIEQQTIRTNGRVNGLEDARDRHNKRIHELEGDSKSTLEFKGKTGVVVGIVIALLGGGILLMARAVMF